MRDGASSAENARSRIAYLDGLRAVAVLSVVVFHAAKWFPTLPRGVAQHVLYEGAHGVDLFFVLSGFCLSYPTLHAARRDGAVAFDVVRYWAHRLVRIIPPFYGALALFAVCGLGVEAGRLATPAPAWVAPSSPLDIIRQAFFVSGLGPWTNGSFWSLALEFRWYFVFPLLLWLWVRSPRAFVIIGLASFALYQFSSLKTWDFDTLPAFMLGIVAADLYVRGDRSWRWALPGFVCAVIVAVAVEPRAAEAFAYQPQTGWQLASFFFVAAAGSLAPLRRVLSLRPLVFIGLISYSVYLTHEPVIAFLQSDVAVGPIPAALLAVAVGYAFWLVLERSTTQGTMRASLTPTASSALTRVFAWLELPPALALPSHPSSPTPVSASTNATSEEGARVALTAGDRP